MPDDDFARGRAAVLRDLLAKDSLFHTAAARELWEDRARGNVSAELARLGACPGDRVARRCRRRLGTREWRLGTHVGDSRRGLRRRRPAVTSRATSSRDDTGVAPAASISSYHSEGTS